MEDRKTIVLVLRSGGDFKFRDVELIANHINGKWQSDLRPRIICLWDKVTESYDLGNIEFIPLTNKEPGTWSRIQLYSPEMEQYKPFLYVDLDTAVIRSLENIFNLIRDDSQFITLEDFWQRDQLATGLVWFPKNCDKTNKVWDSFKGPLGWRMDYYIRSICQPDTYWQKLTTTIYDFKPKPGIILTQLPADANLVCFHGKPRIFTVVEASMTVDWVKRYVEEEFPERRKKAEVTVIIPYKVDRGWLKDAIASVPKDVQLLVSQGEGNWPANFNKVLSQAEGKYIRYLHEDDMLTPNCITDSVKAIEEQNVDFIHGDAIEAKEGEQRRVRKSPNILIPTLQDLLSKNVIHSATTMYRREIFTKIGGFDETLNTAEEFEFHLRCLKAGFKIGYCPNVLAIYRRHPLQKVRTVAKEQKDKEREEVRKRYME